MVATLRRIEPMSLSRDPARTAGWLYLAIIVFGAFGLLYPSTLIVRGDPPATASHLLAHESLYRLSIVSALAASVVFIFLARAFFRMFRDVDKNLAWLMMILIAMMVTIGMAFTV